MRKSRPQTALADFSAREAAKAVAGKQNLVSSGSGSSSLPPAPILLNLAPHRMRALSVALLT